MLCVIATSLVQAEQKILTTQRDNSRRKVTELSKMVEQLEADLEKKKDAITRFEVSVMHVTILNAIAVSNVWTLAFMSSDGGPGK